MEGVILKSHPDIKKVFTKYPDLVNQKLHELRQLIIDTANDLESIDTLEETLKWGEPSYIVKHGSTIRIDWKHKKPDQYAIYFKCTSKLVATFKEVYKNDFTFEGNRAIVFNMSDRLPIAKLKKCITAGLTYHKIKHLPLLGL